MSAESEIATRIIAERELREETPRLIAEREPRQEASHVTALCKSREEIELQDYPADQESAATSNSPKKARKLRSQEKLLKRNLAKVQQQYCSDTDVEEPIKHKVQTKPKIDPKDDVEEGLSGEDSYVEADDELSDNYHQVDEDEGDPMIEYDAEGNAVEYISDDRPEMSTKGNVKGYGKAVIRTVLGDKVRRGLSGI